MPTAIVPIDAERFTRHGDPETSTAAAEMISTTEMTELQQNIIHILRDCGPLTDEGIWEEYNARRYPRRKPQRLRSARDEITDGYRPPARVRVRRVLVREPRIRRSALPKAQLPSGAHAYLWELIPEGDA